MSEYLRRVARIEEDTQQRAAFHSSGSQVVQAGPGSGKTYLLTTKIAKTLLEGTVRFPQQAACITFSRQLAANLLVELQKLGVFSNERVYVGTIHAFCIAEIIIPGAHLLEPGVVPNPFGIASEQEMVSALGVALEAQGKRLPRGKWDKRNVLSNIDKYRRLHYDVSSRCFNSTNFPEVDGYSLESYADLDWLVFAQDYTRSLRNNGSPSVDFVHTEIMALNIVHTFPQLAATLSAAYPWWFVDEYQDLSRLFHQIVISLISDGKVSVFAIGDQNQCIYEELQGSNPEFLENLAHIVEDLNGNNSITLQTNYRSAQNIIDLGDVVLEKKLGYQSRLQIPGECHVLEASKCQSTVLVKRCLQKLVGNSEECGLVSGNIAILSPKRAILKRLWRELENQSAWRVAIDKDPDYEARFDLAAWVLKVAMWCVGGKVHFHQLIPFWLMLNQVVYGTTDQRCQHDLEQTLFATLWSLRNKDQPAWDWLFALAIKLDFDPIFREYAQRRPGDVAELRALYEAVKTGRLRKQPLRQFAKVDVQILLTTLHGSKGLEFDAAIIVGLDQIWDSAIPDLKSRLAYVGVTRAKTHAYIFLNQDKSLLADKCRKEAGGILKYWYCENGNLTQGTKETIRPNVDPRKG